MDIGYSGRGSREPRNAGRQQQTLLMNPRNSTGRRADRRRARYHPLHVALSCLENAVSATGDRSLAVGSARTRRRALPWESSLCLPSVRLASFWSSWTGFRYLDPLWWMQRVLAAPARYPRATGHIIPGYPDGANYPGHLHRCRARLGGSIKSVRPDELSQPDVRTCCSVRVRRHYIRHLQDEPTWKFFYRNTFDRD